MKDGIRARGDLELFNKLKADPTVKSFTEKMKRDRVDGTRRYLLGTAVRLTKAMAPSLHNTIESSCKTLEIDKPFEIYVSPSPHYNAFSYGAEGDTIYIGVTSTLYESFTDKELAFVLGHELGHYQFGHHDIPVVPLIKSGANIDVSLVLNLYAWQRYAEISADRAGLVCVGEVEPTAKAFLKLASGLKAKDMKFDVDEYIRQVGDIAKEAQKDKSLKGQKARADWFSSHPFSPLRVRAVKLCAESVVMGQSLSLDKLEDSVHELMTLMEPSYLIDQSPEGETMRRLLFAGGVMVASADKEITDDERKALERFLGDGSLPSKLNVEAIEQSLAKRINNAKESVSELKRAQVVRDLCHIAHADGRTHPMERQCILKIAEDLDVAKEIVVQTLANCAKELD